MNRWIKLVIAVSIILTISSCSLPIKAVKVKSSDPVKGVRYVLKRPSFKVGLRIIDIKYTKFFKIDKKGYDDYNDSKTPIIEHKIDTNNTDFITEDNDLESKYYCLHPESQIQVTFQQKMTGTPFIYEVSSRATPPHWFADSDSSIVMDDKGNLIGISAGETDRSLEFIESIAALASKSATAGIFNEQTMSDTNYCLLFIDESFHRYITEHLKLDKAKKDLTDQLEKIIGALDVSDPKKIIQTKFLLESASLLRSEIEIVNKKLKVVQYNMKKDTFDVKIKSSTEEEKYTSILKKPPSNPWIYVELTAN